LEDSWGQQVQRVLQVIPSIWEDDDGRGSVPWWNLTKDIEEFNAQRREKIQDSMCKVEHESKSAWCPRKIKNRWPFKNLSLWVMCS